MHREKTVTSIEDYLRNEHALGVLCPKDTVSRFSELGLMGWRLCPVREQGGNKLNSQNSLVWQLI